MSEPKVDQSFLDSLSKMTEVELISGIASYKAKIGTENNKQIIHKLEQELFARDWTQRWL